MSGLPYEWQTVPSRQSSTFGPGAGMSRHVGTVFLIIGTLITGGARSAVADHGGRDRAGAREALRAYAGAYVHSATHTTVLSKRATFGLSANNNPTVQDVWNSTPAWGFPYGSSAVAPTPAAATLIDGTLGQQVAGLTAYTMWNDRVYGEFGAYRSAPLGIQRPLDSTATGVIKGAAPYWRVAFPNVWGQNYLSVGTYGIAARVFPAGVAGPTNRFTDVALDIAYMRSVGSNSFTLDGTWIHEKKTWTAGGAANPTHT